MSEIVKFGYVRPRPFNFSCEGCQKENIDIYNNTWISWILYSYLEYNYPSTYFCGLKPLRYTPDETRDYLL